MTEERQRDPHLLVAGLMVAFGLATWGVDAVDGVVGTVVLGWVVLVLAVTVSGFVLEGQGVPRPLLVGVLAPVVAAWLTLGWYVGVWAAGRSPGPVVALAGSLVAAQAGGAFGAWLALAPRPVLTQLQTPVVFLAVLPPLVVWAAWARGDRPEIEAMTDDLEATGVPPYRVEIGGYDLEQVRPGAHSLVDGPGITFQLRPHDESVRYLLDVVVVSSDTDLCPATPDCLGLYEQVELTDAVALVRRPDSPDDLGADLDDVLADVGGAELVTYGELARLHPPADED